MVKETAPQTSDARTVFTVEASSLATDPPRLFSDFNITSRYKLRQHDPRQ